MARTRSFAPLGRRPIFHGRVIELWLERWRGPHGRELAREQVVHPGAVAILPVTARGTFLFVRQFRAAARQRLLEIPAGTLERRESPIQCARRELREEVGRAARRWRKLGVIYTAPGFCNEVIHLFEARELRPAAGEPDADEEIEVVELSAGEVRRAVKRGTLQDGKSLSALYLSGRCALR
ncbi:MAG: NUDIX hydrolase [Planctomycetota bacterium]